jgi:putative membrane protein
MKKILLPLMALSLLVTTSCNNAEQNDSAEVAEERNEQKADSANLGDNMENAMDFAVEAASGGLMEVELGKLAATNAASPKVKEFGQTMVKDHGKANEELKALAAQKNISIPSTPGEKHQSHIEELKTKKGADFDKAYMSMMVEDHEEDINKFEKASQNDKDADIKAFASKTLPVLRQHHEMAKTINDGLKQ